MNLRRHQSTLQQLVRDPSVRLIVANVTPGAGKSLLPVIAAVETRLRICWVVPRRSLQRQAEDAFLDPGFRALLGHRLQIRQSTNEADPCRGLHGYVTTYQAVGQAPELHAAELRQRAYVLVLDEPHHVEKDGTWHAALQDLVEHAHLVLMMSGTMERGDGNRIAFLPYNRAGEVDVTLRPDAALITYGRQEALSERAIKPLTFERVDGRAEWKRDGADRSVDSLAGAGLLAKEALYTALHTEYAGHLLALAVADWRARRSQDPTAALLVVSPAIERAGEYLQMLRSLGVSAGIATSDDSDRAETAIRAFKRGQTEALVTVAMAYEGLDVPAITHIACLTHVRSKPWIEQMLARAARVNHRAGPYEVQCGRVFVPDDPMMRRIIVDIEAEQVTACPEPQAVEARTGLPGDGPTKPTIEPISSEAIVQTMPALPETPSEAERRERAAIEGMVRQHARITGASPRDINLQIYRAFGKSRTAMKLAELERLRTWAERNLQTRRRS